MTYITVADIRTAGMSIATADDATVMNAILTWQPIIERITRQFFEPKTCDFYLDGNDSDTLHLPFPVISLSSLYVNNDSNACDVSYYRVYNGRGVPNDDRRNPRIAISSGDGASRDIYTASHGSHYFRKGKQNQRLVGVFGFTEADGSTPLAIKRALTKLVIIKLAQPLYIDGNNPQIAPALPPAYSSGIITDEWTDWHRIKREGYNQTLPKRADGMSEIIEDPEIRGLLKLYRAPLSIATPANFGWK